MADAKLSVGSVGIPSGDHLMGLVYKASDLSTLVQSHDLYPANSGNFIYTGLDAGVYRFFLRDSPDGIALGTIIGGPYDIDVSDETIEIEYIFYTVDGGGAHDPATGDVDIIDPTLNGKNIQGVFKEGFRFLKVGIEYDLITGGGIHLYVGNAIAAFNGGEVFTVIVANIVATVTTTAGLFAGSALISADIILDGTFINMKTKCQSLTNRLNVLLMPVSAMAEGKFFYLSTYGGMQFNTVFNTQAGDQIVGYGSQIILGKNEILWIEKRGSNFEILTELPGVVNVGRRSDETDKGFINMMPEDDRLLLRLDYPRIHSWVLNKVPATNKVIATDSEIATKPRTEATRAMFMISDNYLRMPDTQNLSPRGLKNYNAYNTDTTRLSDYPGGQQLDGVGQHNHISGTETQNADPLFNKAAPHPAVSWSSTPQYFSKPSSTGFNFTVVIVGSTPTIVPAPLETTVKNFGTIGMRNI